MGAHKPSDTTNLDRYGHDPLPWSRAADALDRQAPGPSKTYVLGTVRPDGRPHAAAVGVLWHEHELFFTSGPGTRKARNLAENPACTIAVGLEGIDLVFEGEARRESDPATLEAAAARYRAGGWPATVEGDAFTAPFSAPSAGPPPWHLYRVTVHTAFGVSTKEPWGATRWRFGR